MMNFHNLKGFTLLLLTTACLASPSSFATVDQSDKASFKVWDLDFTSQKYRVLQQGTVDTPGELTTVYLSQENVFVGDSTGALFIWTLNASGIYESVFSLKAAHKQPISAIYGLESSLATYGADGVIIQWTYNAEHTLTKKQTIQVSTGISCSLYGERYSQPTQWVNSVCKIDCSKISNAISDGTAALSCVCSLGYDWSGQRCIQIFQPNCQLFENSDGTFSQQTNSCNCVTNYSWVGNGCRINCSLAIDASQCLLVAADCTAVDYSTGIPIGIECMCVGGYTWNKVGKACWKNCASIPNSPGTNVNTTECSCNAGFYFVNNSCEINCSAIAEATTATSSSTCNCQSGLNWESNICVRNCSALANTNGVASDPTACACKSTYAWSGSGCAINCSAVANSAGASASGCACNSGYSWSGSICAETGTGPNLGLILGVSIGVGVPVAILLLTDIAVAIYQAKKRHRQPRLQIIRPPYLQNVPNLQVTPAVTSTSNIFDARIQQTQVSNLKSMKSMNTMSTLPPPTFTNIPTQASLIRPVAAASTPFTNPIPIITRAPTLDGASLRITPKPPHSSVLRQTMNNISTHSSAIRPTTSTNLQLTPQSTLRKA